MIFKVISKGLILNKFSYLRNGWNVLDCVVVVFGFITESYEYFSDERDKPDLDLFRTFRVLRAVKTISILPGLRMIINSLSNAIIQLLEVMLLTAFCLCIFSLFALELYQGKLHHVCVLIKGSETSIRTMVEGGALEPILETDPDRHHEYALWVNNRFNWFPRDYPTWEYQPCGNDTGSRSCPTDYICLPSLNDNPDDGWTSFDNIFYSMLSTFQLITLDYWERLYELVMSTAGAVSVFFFIMVVFLGSFYLMNLMLAVVAMSYETEAHTWEQKPLTKHQKLALHRSDSTFSFDDPLKLNVTIMTTYRRRSPGEREMLARTLRNASIVRPTVGDTGARLAAAGSLTEAVMNMLGRRVSAGAPPSTPMTLTGTTYQPKDYTAELNARASEYIDVNTEPRIRPPASKAPSASVMENSHAPSLLSVDSSTSQDRIDTKTVLNMQATLAAQYDRTRNDKKRFFDSIHPDRVRQKLTPIVTNSAFEMFITISIVLNTILLASEHYGMPAWLENTIQYGSHSFSAIFAFECIIKIAALQRDYFSQYWNLFDLFVVLISIFDLILELLPNTDNYFAFRVVRLFRIFKLAQSWLTMKVLLNIIFSTFGALGNLTLVLAIFIYIFAILGMQVIGLRYTPENFGATDPIDEYFPRWNFMDFWHAFMMVFRTLCGEWIEPLWECLLCHKGIAEWKCFIIFLPILIFGNFIVLNLFLALLLNSFNTEEFKAQRDKEKEMSGKVNNLKKVVGMLMLKSDRGEDGKNDGDVDQMRRRLSLPVVHGRRESRLKVKFKAATHKVIAQNRKYCTIRAIRRADEKQGRKEKSFIKNPLLEPPGESNSRTSQPEEQDDEKDTRLRDCFPVSLTNYNNPCFRFIRNRNLEEWTKVRTFCLKICVHPSFEWVILVLILASSITLCFEDVYLDEKPTMKLTLFILNNCFTAIFIIEMIFKWMAFGLHKYFTTFWTLLDAFIVIVSIVTFAFDMKDKSWLPTPASQSNIGSLDSLKALRTLRALRPLRAISKWQGMKVVVNALLYAIPSIVNVLLVCLLFWLVFSIMGVQFFKGKFFKCVYSETGNVVAHSIVANMQTCCSHPDMSWINQLPNFDNVLQGYLSLFQVATFEGWMELMRAASDIPSHSYENPKRGQSYGWNAFFVVFIIFGSFFTLNLFIGVIIDNFNMLKKKYEGNLVEILLTPSQRRYYTAMKKLGRKKPQRVIKRPANKCLAICYDISVSRRFEVSIFVMIFLNMIVMSFEHHGQEQVYTQILEGSNSFFVAIYTLEALVKIAGMRHYYFTFPWNIFDFFLVVISIVIDLIIVETKVLGFPPTLLRVFRVFRIGRVLRLIKSAKGIRKLLFALIVSLPALFNIGALLALLTFIYAIVGMALFKDVAFYQPIDEVFSFQTFPKSMLMLFRLMTAAGWNDVLYSLTAAQVTCGSYRKMLCGREGEPKCSPPFAAVIFMVSYLILSFLIVINMYIAIILENFVEANRDEEIGIVEDDLEMFYVRWSRYDPSATQFINFDQLSEFLACLDPPLNIPRPNIVAIVSFNLPIARGNKIHCLDILHALVKHALGQVDDSEEFRKVQEQMELKFRKQFPGRKLLDIISSTRIWKIQHNAAIIIQRAWRAYFARTRGPDAIPYQRRGSLQGQPQTQGRRASTGSAIANTFARIGNFFSSDKDKGRKSSLPYQTTLKFTRNKDGSNEAGTETSAKQKNPKRVSFVEEIQEMNRETRRQEALQKSGLGGAGSSTQKK